MRARRRGGAEDHLRKHPDRADPPGTQLGAALPPGASAKLRESQTLFTEADQALKNGDLGTYQTKTNQARDALNEAIKLMGG